MKKCFILAFAVLMCVLLLSTLRAQQILWEHKTSDVWLNPETNTADSTIAFTAISNYGKSVTAAAIIFDYPVNPVGRITFYRSNDDGLTWFEQSPTVPNEPYIMNWGITKIQQIDSLHVVAIGDKGTVYRTSDAGVTWQRRDAPVIRELLSIHFSSPLEGILLSVGTDSTIFTTTDGGEHWVFRQFDLDNLFSCYSYGNGKFSFFRYWRGPIYTTTDNFATLDTSSLLIDSIVNPKPRYIFSQCNFEGGDTLFAYGSYIPEDSPNSIPSIIRSVNGGKSWETPWLSKDNTLARIKHVTSALRDTIFASGDGLRYYLISTDKGETWRADSIVTDTTYDQYIKCFGMVMSQDGHPLAIYGPGPWPIYSIIWRGKYQTSKVELAEVMRYYTKIYPNPAYGRVTIQSVALSNSTVAITDMLGRVVAKGKLSEEGKAEFDLTNKPRGIYYVTLAYSGREYMVGKIALTLE